MPFLYINDSIKTKILKGIRWTISLRASINTRFLQKRNSRTSEESRRVDNETLLKTCSIILDESIFYFYT